MRFTRAEKMLFRLLWLLPLCFSSGAALADLLVVVNQESPLASLSQQEVKKIFLGRMRYLPGTNKIFAVYDRSVDSVIYKTFYVEIAGMSSQRLKRYRARYLFSGQGLLPEQVDSFESLLGKLRTDTSAISYFWQTNDTPVPEGLKVVYRHGSSEAPK